jgi:hypothetical protein
MRAWLRLARWTLAAIGFLLLVRGGVSIFGQPDRETIYAAAAPLVTCVTEGCFARYGLEVGNTGSREQPEIRVRLRAAALEGTALPLRVRDFGKLDRAFQVDDADGVRTVRFGPVARDQRVEVAFMLRRANRAALPDWPAILIEVTAAEGPVRAGSAPWVSLARVWYGFFRLW